jgi:hypothetical protein
MGNRRIAAMVSAFAVSALVAGTAAAETSKSGLPGGCDETLTIEHVDAAAKTFTAGEGGQSQQFTVDDKTRIFKTDHQIELRDLAVGDRVAVSYPLTEKGRDRVPAKVVQVVTRTL